MSSTTLQSAAPHDADAAHLPLPSKWLHRYAVFVAACAAILVFAGGLVTSTGASLSVPDWPLSYGMLFPPMVGNVRFEHGHRMIATTVGLLTILLAIWLHRSAAPSSVRRLGWWALGAVVVQGILGGLTVLLLLPTGISVAHACLGQTFFCILVGIALFTSPGWRNLTASTSALPSLRSRAVVLSAAVYVQLLVGALMRHTGAGLAIPDFPLAFGALVPPLESGGVIVHFAHRVVGAFVALWALWTAAHALRRHHEQPQLLRPAVLVAALAALQVLLGGITVWTGKSVVPTTLHVLNGALILATSFVLTLRCFRVLQRRETHLRFEPLVERQVMT
jgi:cytochrome c oxidase assembly protein subunit 15